MATGVGVVGVSVLLPATADVDHLQRRKLYADELARKVRHSTLLCCTPVTILTLISLV